MKVLVTGAGGSIGSQLVKTLLADETVSKLILVDLCELNLYTAQHVFEQNNKRGIEVEYLLCDVRDESLMCAVFWERKPDVVYHAAALKHVPTLETTHNVIEAIRTNVLGTKVVMDMAAMFEVKQLVLVSTDKAVEPISLMGATKTAAEGYCREMGDRCGMSTCIVRFGNVVGSSVSVIPLWEKQIAAGGPVTVTHKDMYRYMMSIADAVYLMTQAAGIGGSGTYMLEMGEPVHMLDLARRMILDSTRKGCGHWIEIKFTGIRPGEKLVEKLHWDYEVPVASSVAGVYGLNEVRRNYDFIRLATALRMYTKRRDVPMCKKVLHDAVDYDMGVIECASL